MKQEIKLIIFTISFIIACIITVITLTGCISAPDRKCYEQEACYDAAYCRYLAAKSKTALDCSKAADACEKIRTLCECQKKSAEIKDLTFQSCWDKLR